MEKKVELTDVLNDASKTAMANMHTIVVAKVVKVGATTIDVQPVIQRVVRGEAVDLPVFPSVPPVFLSGGESYDAHPIAEGDYCLLLVSERSFDRWYMGDDNVPPIEQRMHDYSDCFALVGIAPAAFAKTIPTTIERNGDSTVTGNWVHSGDYTLTGLLQVIGNTSTTGNTESGTYSVGGLPGWSGVIRTVMGRDVTVTHGIITSVV